MFVDTGPIVARYLEHDPHHDRAVTGWKRLLGRKLVTTPHVLVEVSALLGNKVSQAFAHETLQMIVQRPDEWTVIRPTDGQEERLLSRICG